MLNWNAFLAIVLTSSARSRSSTHPAEGDPSLPAVDAAAVLANHAAHVGQIYEKNF